MSLEFAAVLIGFGFFLMVGVIVVWLTSIFNRDVK